MGSCGETIENFSQSSDSNPVTPLNRSRNNQGPDVRAAQMQPRLRLGTVEENLEEHKDSSDSNNNNPSLLRPLSVIPEEHASWIKSYDDSNGNLDSSRRISDQIERVM